jgi:hypothetical protein
MTFKILYSFFFFEERGFALLFGLHKKEFLVDNYTSSYYLS